MTLTETKPIKSAETLKTAENFYRAMADLVSMKYYQTDAELERNAELIFDKYHPPLIQLVL